MGTLQDLSLRKQGMEAAYNQQQAQQKLAELQNSQRGSLEKDMDYIKANPQDMPLIKEYQKTKNPFGEANIALRAAGQDIQRDNLALNQEAKLVQKNKVMNELKDEEIIYIDCLKG